MIGAVIGAVSGAVSGAGSGAVSGAPRGAEHRLRVDWPSCHARGLCHELLPELVDLDRWGYPLLLGEVSPDLEAAARAAVASCPRRALRLESG